MGIMKFTKKQITLAIAGITVILVIIFGSKIFETVEKGHYIIKQAAVTGTMTAHLNPGMFLQLFGDIQVWPKAATFYFTADREEGGSMDQSIEIRFNDGSLCHISGTMRIILPASSEQAIALTTVQGYGNEKDLEVKLILPTVRNALRLTANLMSARESYSAKRADYNFWAWDQIQNGLYETREVVRKVVDPLSGDEVTKTFKLIQVDSVGNAIHQLNPLQGLGLRLGNFEIKTFIYAHKVQQQIAAQQDALMGVETAAARAREAEQNALTVEAQGKAKVMTAKYEKEQEKVKAVVEAHKNKEVAELSAEKELEVAKLQKKAAEFTKRRDILLGQGEAERKRLVLRADGALKQKLETFETINQAWADAYSKRNVPQLVMGGNGTSGTDQATLDFSAAMQLLVARQLGLDLRIPRGAATE